MYFWNKNTNNYISLCQCCWESCTTNGFIAGKIFKSLLSKGEAPAMLYGMSQNGWMDQELFTEWFLHHFLEHAVSSRLLILLLDGHSSHFTLEVVKLAAAMML